MGEKKQDKIGVSFSKDKQIEQNLYAWILEKGKIIGASTYIKQVMYEKYIQEKEGK
ncbi:MULTISPECIES: hypothetical protein [unclassified Clostridium]|uniref:hypothetical protein n=1 Tax=unclassified Clostridium TaxID=2614128 RepID=UPI0020796C52|nr:MULTISPECIES: hypothetical protein [unclassified Clostridium]